MVFLSVLNKPTRKKNILDLVWSTYLDLINQVRVYPGMSDHSIIITEINIMAKPAKKKPRQIFLFKRGNMEGVKEDMKDLYHRLFEEPSENMSVENLGSTFIAGLSESI